MQQQTKNLLFLMKDASLTDITCLEELIKKCVKENLFKPEVYNTLWRYYTEPNTLWAKPNNQMSQDQINQLRAISKQEQRSAIQILRMAGTTSIEVLLR